MTIEAAESLATRYNEGVSLDSRSEARLFGCTHGLADAVQAGCIRSWDRMTIKADKIKEYSRDDMEKHYLVIIDNMVSTRIDNLPVVFRTRHDGCNSLADMFRVDESGYPLPRHGAHR